MSLDNFIKAYKRISLDIKESLDNDDLDSLERLLDERQNIINNKNICNCDLEKLKELCKRYEIFELDKLIFEEMKLQKDQLRKKICEAEKGKRVSKGYNNLNAKAVFLSKEI